MNILQDIMGLITKRKIKTPSDNDYIVSAVYTDTQERLKPQPKMEANLLSLGAIKKYVISGIASPNYKVFTALLTQSGGDNPTSFSFDDTPGGPDFAIGVTYQIADNTAGLDVTNIGAQNNEIGTYFVATGTRPTNWGEGSLTYNTGAPVATVLENTIGNIYWTIVSDGSYKANLVGPFVDTKTFVTITNPNSAYTGTPGVCDTAVDIDFIQLSTFDSSFVASNDQLFLNAFEIRVYN